MNKSEATKAAKNLKAKMHTKGWRISVWENLGWHFCISNCGGMISVYQSDCDGKYSCLLSDGEYKYCGSELWLDHNTYSDPNKAVNETLKMAFHHLCKIESYLFGIFRKLAASGFYKVV